MDLRGFLVRCHRLQRNYSQEGLCRGICAVSYLSKLEQGKVQAADEIYQALFHRLGIVFQENEEWLAVWKEKLQELASAWFYGEQREAYELEKQMENLLNLLMRYSSKHCIRRSMRISRWPLRLFFFHICRMHSGSYIIFYVRDRHFKAGRNKLFQRYLPSCRKHKNMEGGVFYIR